MKPAYLETIALIERLHRQCMELVKTELDRLGVRDLNAVQAMILFNLGDSQLTVGELTQRGYYLGSNVSYNVKKMVENGYLHQERSPHDKRATHLQCSEKGMEICNRLDELFDRHARELANSGVDEGALGTTNDSLQRLEGFWAAARVTGVSSVA
ncbi:DNA-binding transcriptional regulator, MarR family [Limimonas halophila]|uniref:DNA-binding transcriptional regulator, MarR family n=1 Tax=Limimonas halophila TaxID=1082479 RepID=A0A1G7NWX9_9PROT|nr:MarR family transcriptional regulator [Limimonas halophila]SDF78532.1 DNA-binding transcriptional regulator, MarR family [Limimonas halophila]